MVTGQTLKLAFRNLGRNTRRTVITGLALSASTALFIAYYAIVDGMNAQLVHSLTRFDVGHLQAHGDDWLATHSLTTTVPESAKVLDTIREDPEIRAASARVYVPALVSAGAHSTGVQLIGVDPQHERQVTELDRQLVAGRFVDATATPWPAARELTAEERRQDANLTQQEVDDVFDEIDALPTLKDTAQAATPAEPDSTTQTSEAAKRLSAALSPLPERPPHVVLGRALARVLGVSVGDTLYASAQSADGTAEGVQLAVSGIYETGTLAYDRTRIYMHITDLQRLSHLEGRYHEIAAALTSPYQAAAAAERLKRVLDQRVDVQDWGSLRPDMVRMLDLNRSSTAFLALIVLFVAALGVVNTMLMSVAERARELGVLKAIGMSGGRVFGMIVVETAVLALVAGGVGGALGLGLDWYLVEHGVDLSFMTTGISFGGVRMRPVVYGEITAGGVLWPLVFLSGVCLVAAVYPALRAAAVQPAVGMRET